MVKYKLSTPGISRSCSRVTSPLPAFSTLITSAPNHASSCVHVGPDWTCVKSRMRTPSNALLMPCPCVLLLAGWTRRRMPSRLFLGRVIEIGDAAALGAAAFVDDRVDQRRPPRANRLFHRRAQL